MYLAPLNYDRYFKKIFSDERIVKRFLEDFLEVPITFIEQLPEKHQVTDDAAIVEFDYRYQINEWLQQGRAEGEAEAKRDLARQMLNEGLPLAMVVKITGLSEAEIFS